MGRTFTKRISALEKAVELVGGRRELAKKCGVTRQAVENWLAMDTVPVERLKAIQKATGGAVTPADLRPDIARIFA